MIFLSIQKLHSLLRREGNIIGPCIDTQFLNREYKGLICQDKSIYAGKLGIGFISHVFTGVDFRPVWNARQRNFTKNKWGDLPSTEAWYKSERDLQRVYNWYKPEKKPINGFNFSLAQRKYLIMEHRCVLSIVLFVSTRMIFMRPDLMTNLGSESEIYKNVCIQNYGVQTQFDDQDKGKRKNPGLKCLQDFDIKTSKFDKDLWEYNLARWLPEHDISREEEERMETDNPQAEPSPIDRKLAGRGKSGSRAILKSKKSNKTGCYKPKWLETPKSEEPSTSKGKSTSRKYSVWTEEESRGFGSRSASTSTLKRASEDLRRQLIKKNVGRSREERSRRRKSRSRSASSSDSSSQEYERSRSRKRRHRYSSSSTSSGDSHSSENLDESIDASFFQKNLGPSQDTENEKVEDHLHANRASGSSSVSKLRQERAPQESISTKQPPEMDFPRDNASRAKTAFHACLNCGVDHFGHVCLRPLQGLSCGLLWKHWKSCNKSLH